ncbi:SemiSWEET transporter [uncultured Gelidibacter sp.]|uniref:SemiSWEET family sugar transporter n=1 Tax=uncultured Gelidibacter sp. TaxID=259318 RepID=UPI0026373DC4|nr:SemiSWEET transporter [uncultured Gelidibacter sp.]
MTLEEIIGIVAGVLTTVAVLPQIIKAIKTREVEDVSPYMYIILCGGVGLWTVYGVFKMDWPIIVTNGISFILNGIMLYIVLRSWKKNRKQH